MAIDQWHNFHFQQNQHPTRQIYKYCTQTKGIRNLIHFTGNDEARYIWIFDNKSLYLQYCAIVASSRTNLGKEIKCQIKVHLACNCRTTRQSINGITFIFRKISNPTRQICKFCTQRKGIKNLIRFRHTLFLIKFGTPYWNKKLKFS